MLLAAPGLPKALWGEAIATSIYLTNRSPTKALPKGKTPHEMLYGTVPRYRHIKTFGCAAYALKPHAKEEGKLAPRSEKQWLLGYEATTIFRLWDPVKKIVRTSRDINFNETELAPAKCIANPTTSPTSAKVKKFLRLLKKFGTSKVTKPAQLAQSCSEYDFVNKSTPTLLRVSIE
jgi:hypothetical protein